LFGTAGKEGRESEANTVFFPFFISRLRKKEGGGRDVRRRIGGKRRGSFSASERQTRYMERVGGGEEKRADGPILLRSVK